MNFLLFQLKRLVMLPFQIVSSPKEMISSLWNESGRSRALLLGLPSILFAAIGVLVLLWAKFGIANSLEDRYQARVENSAQEKSRLLIELRRELRMLEASQQAGTGTTASASLIPKDDPRRLELETWRSREKIYLEKLIDLNPENSEYLFQLALVSFDQGDVNRCLALMHMTSPLDEPGYVKGHLWLAKFYMGLRVKTQGEAVRNIARALQHAEQCLKRDQENVQAKQIKATLLYAQKRNLDVAYEIFEELFQNDPRTYKALLKINELQERLDRNDAVLESAIARFEYQLKNESFDIAEEIQLWRDLITCYLEKKQYGIAEEKLINEVKRQSEMKENSGRVWAERMLGNVYVARAGTIDQDDPEKDQKRLEFFKKAFKHNRNNPEVLRQLTRLSVSDNSTVATEAITIYNAALEHDAPASVLNEIGSQALARSDYDSALRFFEMARKKSPRNPEILNNLAYTYIVGDEPNPDRGLTLIDEALRRLPKNAQSKKYLTFFRDTRGQALMQLNHWTEAAAEFEIALLDRPNNKGILEALVKCYRANGLDPSAYVERLRVANENDKADTQD